MNNEMTIILGNINEAPEKRSTPSSSVGDGDGLGSGVIP